MVSSDSSYETLTAGEGVQSPANVTLTNTVREKYSNVYKNTLHVLCLLRRSDHSYTV